MSAYDGLSAYFGDLHNHCGISYGHGSLEEAYANARERLDFCSVTGHAFWPDMPAAEPRIQFLIDFHEEGFARLQKQWPSVVERATAADRPDEFVVFLSYEMHSGQYGDHTILYRDLEGDILYCDGLPELRCMLRQLRERGHDAIAFPHHIGYRLGARGINWDEFTPEFSPIVEILSMHGCSEASENTRPFLHSMGPSDWHGTMQYGLARGHTFGVVAGTDHHSAHPGSYGHGLTGVWAEGLTREHLWQALQARRTYALTGDRMALKFSINEAPMGSALEPIDRRHIEVDLDAGGPIDCIDVMKNNRLLHRFSQPDIPVPEPSETVHTKLVLELGWGHRGRPEPWEVDFGISEGELLGCEARFRGQEVVSPIDKTDDSDTWHTSHWRPQGPRGVHFTTVTAGNPNNSTPASQGVCLEVRAPRRAEVQCTFNGIDVTVPLERLLEGAKSGNLGGIDTPAWRLHRAPLEHQWRWQVQVDDVPDEAVERDVYYVRVRQLTDQWAWSSPIVVAR